MFKEIGNFGQKCQHLYYLLDVLNLFFSPQTYRIPCVEYFVKLLNFPPHFDYLQLASVSANSLW